ncbi:hypothetical protein [Ilumatobacter sp.]|uniref:hypothetical protein n=1 Tax=Ilumatobacter sp. TaxID=1967498 RepID=UPI003B522569
MARRASWDVQRSLPIALVVALAVLLASCGSVEVFVTTDRSDRILDLGSDRSESTTTIADGTDPDDVPDASDGPAATDDAPIDPADPEVDDPVDDEIDASAIDPNAIDFGSDKPPRDYDEFLLAALGDIDTWLKSEFEPAFGLPYRPLDGAVFAGYPERQDDLPGCGEPRTDYDDLQLFVAFYCPIGDFIVYDDGPDGLLAGLAREFGPATIGIVLAHEYGHAVQQRTGALELSLPTVITEQQADCIAGAWAGRAASGLASGIPFDDADIRAGLISMITVQDPVGLDPAAAGGHGSGFDRVGAFQTGFDSDLGRCATLIEDPLPLTPLSFLDVNDRLSGGNATFGFAEGELFGFLVPDLNLLFDNDLVAEFPEFTRLELVPTESADEIDCDEPFGLYPLGAELCSENDTVYLNVPVARELYDDFGDFAPAYVLGLVWSEHAQRSNSSQLTGEARQLRNDCLTGAWVRSVTRDPQTGALPQPRDPDRQASVSPNDLTEAIQAAILIGDPTSDTDVLGTPFQKISAFRDGALGSIVACS